MDPSQQFLMGKQVLITRAKEQAASFSNKIREFGGSPIEIPLLSIESVGNSNEIIHTLNHLDSYQWLIFTSVNGVNYFFSYKQLEKGILPRIAVVGTKTLAALEQVGLHADLIPDQYSAEHLFSTLQGKLQRGDKVLLARGNLAKLDLPRNLKAIGIETTDLIVYETHLNTHKQEELIRLLYHGSIDVITFTSSSTVKHFAEILGEMNWQQYLHNICIVCIGPVTAATAREFNIKVDIVPEQYTIEGMLKEMETFYKSKECRR